MKRNILFGAAMLLAGSLLAADSDTDAVKAAAKKTADSGYSWKTTSANANGNAGRGAAGPREGKVGKDGTVFLTVAGRNNTTEVYIKGEKVAIKGQDGWQSLEEVQAAAANNNNGGNGGGRRGGARFAMYKNYKTPAARIVEELASVKDLKTADGVVSGDLTEDGAKALLTFGGRGGRGGNGNAPEISGAKGSVKFWIKDGAIVKSESHVQGTISRNGQDNDVDRTTTTEFTDVGATTVTVPDEAAKKL
jgi:hypothetical protein